MALPYAPEALEPVISRETIGFHHGKHLAGYVHNLNALLPATEWAELPLVEIVRQATGGVLNNAGQILNHNLYFGQFCTPKADNQPVGKLAEAIVRDFGSFEAFKDEFQKKGAQARYHAGDECRQPRAARPEAPADLRCLGARLLPGLSKPPSRPPRRPLADCRLGGR